MEISGPVLISSSNPTAAARIGELSGGLSSSAPSQVRDLLLHSCVIQLMDGFGDVKMRYRSEETKGVVVGEIPLSVSLSDL